MLVDKLRTLNEKKVAKQRVHLVTGYEWSACENGIIVFGKK